jgi:hypothetical protein
LTSTLWLRVSATTIQKIGWAPDWALPAGCRVGVLSLKIGHEQVAGSPRRASCFVAGPQLAPSDLAADLAYLCGGFV